MQSNSVSRASSTFSSLQHGNNLRDAGTTQRGNLKLNRSYICPQISYETLFYVNNYRHDDGDYLWCYIGQV